MGQNINDYSGFQQTPGIRHAPSGGAGGAYAPPDFGGSVNPISTRGAHYPHPLLPAPQIFRLWDMPE